MKYIIFFAAFLFIISCQTNSSKTKTVFAESVLANSAVKTDDQEISSIRKVNFLNFTFPWTKTFGGKEKSFTLKEGVSKLSD